MPETLWSYGKTDPERGPWIVMRVADIDDSEWYEYRTNSTSPFVADTLPWAIGAEFERLVRLEEASSSGRPYEVVGYDKDQAWNEGWAIFELNSNPYRLQVQRDDERAILGCDNDAVHLAWAMGVQCDDDGNVLESSIVRGE